VAVIRVRHGANAKQVLARHEVPDEAETILAFEPRTVHNLNAVGIIPWVLAVFLALLAAAAIGHALAMSVRARRVEIAVLRALGLVRRQVRLLIAFQATTSVVIGAVIGIPSGILIGRWTWTAVAQGLGVLDRPVVEVAVIGLIGALALTVANVLASAPAVVAGRLKPADILRTE
jgi:ABC-type lipoprotein release transport system permease subunit